MAVSCSDGEFPDKGVVSPADTDSLDSSRMSASVVESETCAA